MAIKAEREHAYACRAQYCYGKSVHQSVHLSLSAVVLKCMHILSDIFPSSDRGMTSFSSATAVTKFQAELPQWGIKYGGYEKFVTFERNRRLYI